LIEPGFKEKRPKDRTNLPWPIGDQGPADPSSMSIEKQGLEKALDAAFSELGPEKPCKTRPVTVVKFPQIHCIRPHPAAFKIQSHRF
jgi:hypothetical protein